MATSSRLRAFYAFSFLKNFTAMNTLIGDDHRATVLSSISMVERILIALMSCPPSHPPQA
jgi:hypothetical protein